jgi:5'-nucleotidase
MKILLVNEAGCFDPGIIALAKALSTRHRVCIVAPLTPYAGIGHRFTTSDFPLRVRQYFVLNRVKLFSVNGTPCDCVTLALDKILKSKPDLIVAGISPYNNRGETVYSSGVVSAAIEGTIQGIPSIAVSAKISDTTDEKNFQAVAVNFTKNLDTFVKEMPKNTTLNINYPEKFSSKKIICTHLTGGMINNKYSFEVNPFGITFYWLKTPVMGFSLDALEQKGDLFWLKKNFITVTPMKLNLTNEEAIPILERAGIEL